MKPRVQRVTITLVLPVCEFSDDGEGWYPWDWRKGIAGGGMFQATPKNLRKLADEIERLTNGEQIAPRDDHPQRVKAIPDERH